MDHSSTHTLTFVIILIMLSVVAGYSLISQRPRHKIAAKRIAWVIFGTLMAWVSGMRYAETRQIPFEALHVIIAIALLAKSFNQSPELQP